MEYWNDGTMGKNGAINGLIRGKSNTPVFQHSNIPNFAFSIGFPLQDGFVTRSYSSPMNSTSSSLSSSRP